MVRQWIGWSMLLAILITLLITDNMSTAEAIFCAGWTVSAAIMTGGK